MANSYLVVFLTSCMRSSTRRSLELGSNQGVLAARAEDMEQSELHLDPQSDRY